MRISSKKNLIKEITNDLKRHFSKNIFSALLYGSAFWSANNIDFDILLILKKKKNILDDLRKLKIIKDKYIGKNLDLQLVYLEEINNPKIFSLDIHGCFFIEILKQAFPLIGENPFLSLTNEIKDIQASVVARIQNYIFRERQEFIGIGRYTKDKNPLYHSKKIRRIIDDILIFDGEFSVHNESLKKFLKNYPHFFNKRELDILNKKEPQDLRNYVPIYEKLYQLILKKAKIHFPYPLLKPLRLKMGKMVSEYLPSFKKTDKLLIVLDGIPSVPKRDELLNIFAYQNYFVFYPRYEGTWESEGNFLTHSPCLEIERLINKTLEGLTLNGNYFRPKKIFILGSSFGGTVALCLKEKSEIKKIIALSPVLEFKKVNNIATLPAFLKENFPGAYRFSLKNWKKLEEGILLNPYNSLLKAKDRGKYFIFGGKNDKEINYKDLEKFAKKFNIFLKLYPNQDHLSFSKINGKILEDILEILK